MTKFKACRYEMKLRIEITNEDAHSDISLPND